MPDISIQFHALPSELLGFAKEIMQEPALVLVAMRFRPFETVRVGEEVPIDECFLRSSPYERLLFTLGPPLVPVFDELDFAKKNPDHLRLDIGKQVEDGLEQSWLTARTENVAAFSVWKDIARRLKRITEKGVTAVNATTGATGAVRSFRYTIGAKELEATGASMYPPQGPNGPRLKLGLNR